MEITNWIKEKITAGIHQIIFLDRLTTGDERTPHKIIIDNKVRTLMIRQASL